MGSAELLKDNATDPCSFCKTSLNDELNFGEKFRLKDLVLHYFCVLLSYRCAQNGADHEGLRGFLYQDIKNEINRAKRIKCEYCRQLGASMQCCKCKVTFHLPCGVVRNSMSRFKGSFPTFCADHRPIQSISFKIMQEASVSLPTCSCCMDPVNVLDPFNSVWAPCCVKNWYHRNCLQHLALSQASLFKCAFCANETKFKSWMIRYGIFIPERDAAWELEPNAFQALQERYSRCDADECLCPHGRKADREGSRWEIVICQTCGSQGTHVRCSSLKFSSVEWDCVDCACFNARLRASKSATPAIESSVSSSDAPKPGSSQQTKSRGRRKSRASVNGTRRTSNRFKSSSEQAGEQTPQLAPKSKQPTPEEGEIDKLNMLEYNIPNSAENEPCTALVKEESCNWLCVRKESPQSNQDSDVEVIEVDEKPTSFIKRDDKMKHNETDIPKDNEGNPIKFLVIGGHVYEVGTGDGEMMVLKKKGPVLQPDLIKTYTQDHFDVVATRPPGHLNWFLAAGGALVPQLTSSRPVSPLQRRALCSSKEEDKKTTEIGTSRNNQLLPIGAILTANDTVSLSESVLRELYIPNNFSVVSLRAAPNVPTEIETIDLEDDDFPSQPYCAHSSAVVTDSDAKVLKKKKKKKRKIKDDNEICILEERTPTKRNLPSQEKWGNDLVIDID